MKKIKILFPVILTCLFFQFANAQSVDECEHLIEEAVGKIQSKMESGSIGMEEGSKMMEEVLIEFQKTHPDCFSEEDNRESIPPVEEKEPQFDYEEEESEPAIPVQTENDEYRAFRKICMKELNPLIKELQAKSRAALDAARTPDEKKKVREGFSQAKSKILDTCAREKMDSQN